MILTHDMIDKAVKIITEHILTPIIYLLESDDFLSFICFCDRHITMGEIYNAEKMLRDETGINAEIVDIREFSESERLDVVNQAVLIHTEHPMIEGVFTQSMIEDFKIAMQLRNDVLTRHREMGTVYLQ